MMDTMTIYTLNINGFRNSGISKLKDLTRRLLVNNECLLVLQEVPHKKLNKRTQPWKWEIDHLYTSFLDEFKKDFNVEIPNHLIDSNQCTVIICNKESEWKSLNNNEIIQYDSKYSYGNKLVEMEHRSKKISLLGLHMNPTNEMWDLILNSERKRRHTIIIGDFNAYEYRGEMSDKYQKLRNIGFESLISSNIITNFECDSSIDNIFISNSYDFKYGISIRVTQLPDNEFKTDHALCSVEFSGKL